MARFRKKPVEIEAWQWNGESASEMRGVCQCSANSEPHVHTAHENTIDDRGQLVFLSAGDWIIPEKKLGRYYPCKPDVFAETYEAVGTADGVTSPMEPISAVGRYGHDADTFEPIGDAAARVVESLTVGGSADEPKKGTK